MGKYYSEHELLNNMYDIVDEDGCILTVLDKDTLKTLPPLIPVRQPVHGYWRCDFKTSEWHCTSCGGIALRMQGYSATALSEYCPHCGAKMLFDEGFDQNEDER